MTDYEEKYEEFWKEIVENPDGTLNKDAVMRELCDYSMILHNAGEVYWHVTGGAISKVNTCASAVISESLRVCLEEAEEYARAAEEPLKAEIEVLTETLEDAKNDMKTLISTAEMCNVYSVQQFKRKWGIK